MRARIRTGLLIISAALACAAPAREHAAASATGGEREEIDDWAAYDAESARRELVVGFYCSPRVYNSELMAPLDVFQHTIFHAPRRDPDHPGMRVLVIGRTRETIRTFEGLRIVPDCALAEAPPLDLLVIPSAEVSMTSDLEDADLIAWLRRRSDAARYVLTYCDGAFPLAATGLLEGRAATTFPGDQDAFAERFPGVRLVREVSYVDAGRFLTSAGGARSYDSALHLVERLYGGDVARGVARGLVIDWDRAAVAHVVDRAAR